MELEEPFAEKDVQQTNPVTELFETDTEEDIPMVPYSDPATKYLHKLSAKTLDSLKA